MPSTAIRRCLAILALAGALAAADPAAGERLLALDQELADLDRRAQDLNAVLQVIGARLDKGANAELDTAREALAAACKEEEALLAPTRLPAIKVSLAAAEKARAEAVDKLAAELSKKYGRTLARRAELDGLIAAIEKKTGALELQELRTLAALRGERDLILGAMDKTYNDWRHVPDIAPLNKALWSIILEQERPTRDAIAGLGEVAKKRGKAEQDLRPILLKAAAATPLAAPVAAELEDLKSKRAQATAAMAEIQGRLLGKTPEWTHKAEIPQTPDKQGKPRPPLGMSLWIAPGTTYVRGIIICNGIGISGGLSKNPLVRSVAAANDLAVILDGALGCFAGPEVPKLLQDFLAKLAEVSKHPEIDRIPLLTMGHSTGGIFCRNVAYWDPDRVMGVVHINSGNLHHLIRPEHDTLAGVPFLAFNGEFEQFGPEGGGHSSGKGGLRSEYGNQTQWIMIREQMLRRRRADPENLMSLVVTAGGDHGSWNGGDNRLCARFVGKCVRYRLPPPPADPTVEVRCRKVPASGGWLSDANLKDPGHSAAPYADYRGDKAEAFWHFDEEMAQGVQALHANLLVPEASRKFPIPADWGNPPKPQ